MGANMYLANKGINFGFLGLCSCHIPEGPSKQPMKSSAQAGRHIPMSSSAISWKTIPLQMHWLLVFAHVSVAEEEGLCRE